MSKAENSIATLDQFKDKHYGKVGTKKRDTLEAGYENFKIGVLIHEARLEKGMTQEQLAENHIFRKLKITLKRLDFRL
jgi:ribosome-binding protein aMBF1 (putative translation factor)